MCGAGVVVGCAGVSCVRTDGSISRCARGKGRTGRFVAMRRESRSAVLRGMISMI